MAGRSLFATPWVALLIATAYAPSSAADPAAAKKGTARPYAFMARPKTTISRETTFLTGPLTPDGYVDYAAAINEHYSKGVTPENNFAVVLLQTFGPDAIHKEIPETYREQFYKMLGMTPLPAEGKYLDSFGSHLTPVKPKAAPAARAGKPENEEGPEDVAWEQFDDAQSRPWTKEKYPLMAAWMEEHEMPLRLLVEGTRRPRFYTPVVGILTGMLDPTRGVSRDAVRVLRARAMLRLGSGRVEEAWQDLLACHRMARLVSQGWSLVHNLIGSAIKQCAIEGDVVLASREDLRADQAMRFADDLRRLPPEERFADKLDRGDRYFMLFVVAACSAGGASTSEVFYSLRYGKCAAFCLGQLCGVGLIDWDEPSRMINSAYDRLRIAMSKPTRAERRAAVDDLHRDLKRIVTEGDDWKTLVKDAVAARSLRIAIGRQMGRALLQVDLPPKVVRADDRYAAYRGMDELLCPLAAYRADHGEYPAELAQLSPKYLKTLPEDPFGKGPLRYKREPKGYVVYSVGYNGKDDGGHDYDLEYDSDLPPEKQPKISKDADDISLRVPPGPKD